MLKNMRVKHIKESNIKSSNKKQELTPEQLAQNSLLEISHFGFDSNDRRQQTPQEVSGYNPAFLTPVMSKQLQKTPMRITNRIQNPIKNSFSQQIKSKNSTQPKSDVSQRITSYHKPKAKQPSSEIYTDHVCVLKKTMAINLEPFFCFKKNQEERTRMNPLRKSSRIYFRGVKNDPKRNAVQRERIQKADSQHIKLRPLRQARTKLQNHKTYQQSILNQC